MTTLGNAHPLVSILLFVLWVLAAFSLIVALAWQGVLAWALCCAVIYGASRAWRWLTAGTVSRQRATAIKASTEPWAALDDVLPSYEDPDHPLGQELGVKATSAPACKPKHRHSPSEKESAKARKERERMERHAERESRTRQLRERRSLLATERQIAQKRLRAAETLEIPFELQQSVKAECAALDREAETIELSLRMESRIYAYDDMWDHL